MSDTVERRPSETALFSALRRAMAWMEYPGTPFEADSLAQYFLPLPFQFFLKFPKIRANTKQQLADAFPGLTEYMIARTAFFDRLLLDALEQETPQIVLLGAGYDSRAYRFSGQNRCSRVFELDIAPTQEQKKRCLRRARITVPPWVSFVPVNFNRDSLAEVLSAAGQPDWL
jgi:methyltransferase (TIGR00027 family)